MTPKLAITCSHFAILLCAALLCAVQDASASCPPESYEQLELADEINLARSEPANYAEILEAYFATMGSDGAYRRDGRLIRTKEGRTAVDEAIAYLRAAPSLPKLRLVSCLSAAANDHIAERASAGGAGHVGADGSRPSDRAARRIGTKVRCGENISYGKATARRHVIALLVDDGVASRGHRKNIFRDNYRTFGVGYGPHARHGNVTVHVMCLDDLVN